MHGLARFLRQNRWQFTESCTTKSTFRPLILRDFHERLDGPHLFGPTGPVVADVHIQVKQSTLTHGVDEVPLANAEQATYLAVFQPI